MRFDDSLRTVLAADTTSAFGAQSAFRQLVDLIGRGRVAPDGDALERLRALRPQVDPAVRAASARALALADPPASLVAFFAEDDAAAAAPVLRSATLSTDDWLALLPRIGPVGRAVLRSRAGLSDAVRRSLDAFGTTDFALGYETAADTVPAEPIAAELPPVITSEQTVAAPGQSFQIADLVHRIDTFQRQKGDRTPAAPTRVDRFAFETDANGVIGWVEGAPRGGLIGRRLDLEPRRGTRVAAKRLAIDGASDAAGEWTVSTTPLFAGERRQFVGFGGVARRTREADAPAIEPEGLRRLVHELRTPTNAISGFAELIGSEMLGSVGLAYRRRADAIGRDVRALIGAIDDLEVSARIDGGALHLVPRRVDLGTALTSAVQNVSDDRLRVRADGDLMILADERALERLLGRLAGTVASAVPARETATVTARYDEDRDDVVVTWPWRLHQHDGSLLGADFALRLAQKLTGALGGRLLNEPDRLTLHLPGAFNG